MLNISSLPQKATRQSSLSRQKDGPITKVNKSNVGNALRLYIPKEVAEELGLKAGDHVRWSVINEDGKPVAKFKKVKLVVEDY